MEPAGSIPEPPVDPDRGLSALPEASEPVQQTRVGVPGDDVPSEDQAPEEHVATEPPLVMEGLVRITDIDPDIVLDLKYATTENFTGQQLYGAPIGLLTLAAAEKLAKANRLFMERGYRIKVWDAYRPLSVQAILWELLPDRRYVANPKSGSRHNRGTAVDITLVDADGQELPMPTGFDEFGQAAHRDSAAMSEEARRNLDLLTATMTQCGFTTIGSEWWHFDDADWRGSPLLDVPLEAFAVAADEAHSASPDAKEPAQAVD